jgi:predicted transcriptional regulator
MSTTTSTIDLPSDIIQALDEIAQTMSLSREETLRVAVMQLLTAEQALGDLRVSLQAAAKRRGIETEEDLYAFLETDD